MAAGESIRAELERVLTHPLFSNAERRSRLLRFLVEETLKGQSASLKESVLAVEVFGRTGEYDPKLDSTVRVEMGRLRSRLVEYYAADGRTDAVRIEIPKGGYQPVFTVAGPDQARVETSSPARGRPARSLVALALIGAAITGLLVWRRVHASAAATSPSLAILPFLNLSGDSGKEYIADSITDEITEELAESSGLRVVARTSAFEFKGQARDVREIGRRLNVSDILEGSLQREGEQLRLVVQLIRSADGYHVWSHTYDGSEAELRQMEAQIAASATRALIPDTQRAAAEFHTTADPQAHDLYLRAAYLFHLGNAGELKQAIELARQATARDPSFVRAYLVIAKSEQNLAAMGASPASQMWDRSLESMQKVAALDPESSEVHTYFAYRSYVYDWNWPKAEREFQLALASPGPHDNAHNLYGWGLMTRKRFAEARRQMEAALEIDPLVVRGARQNLAVDWILERNQAMARQVLNEMLQLNPKSSSVSGMLQWLELNEHDCAAVTAAGTSAVPPGDVWKIWHDAMQHAVCGQIGIAHEDLAKLAAQKWEGNLSPYVLAEAYGLAGDADHAIPLLDQAADQRDSTIMYLELDPLLDSIRPDARFQALARKVGLVP